MTIFILTALSSLYIKKELSWLYLGIVVSLFYFELIYFVYLIATVLFSDNYGIIRIKNFSYSNRSIFQIWFEISKIKAFNRLYLLLSKKKIKLTDFIFVLIVLIAGVPSRLLLLLWDLIIRNSCAHTLKDKIEILYQNLYDNTKSKKIEILHGMIYLNGNTSTQIIKTLCKNPESDLISVLNKWKSLKFHISEFEKFERNHHERVKMMLAHITVDAHSKPLSLHYAQIINLNHLGIKGIVHSTSNARIDVSINQFKTNPIPGMITEYATCPGSVVTTDQYDVTWLPSKWKWVRDYDVRYATYNANSEFILNVDDSNYFKAKNQIISEITGLEFKTNKWMICDIGSGRFYDTIVNSKESDIIDIIDTFLKK